MKKITFAVCIMLFIISAPITATAQVDRPYLTDTLTIQMRNLLQYWGYRLEYSNEDVIFYKNGQWVGIIDTMTLPQIFMGNDGAIYILELSIWSRVDSAGFDFYDWLSEKNQCSWEWDVGSKLYHDYACDPFGNSEGCERRDQFVVWLLHKTLMVPYLVMDHELALAGGVICGPAGPQGRIPVSLLIEGNIQPIGWLKPPPGGKQ